MISTTTRQTAQQATAPCATERPGIPAEITAATPLAVFLDRYRRITVCKELLRKRR